MCLTPRIRHSAYVSPQPTVVLLITACVLLYVEEKTRNAAAALHGDAFQVAQRRQLAGPLLRLLQDSALVQMPRVLEPSRGQVHFLSGLKPKIVYSGDDMTGCVKEQCTISSRALGAH